MISDGQALTGVYLENQKYHPTIDDKWTYDDDVEIFETARKQLTEYFDSKRTNFDLAFKFVGTEFQKEVWKQLSEIPFGKTISYLELAQRIGRPKAVRAVGQANGRNPISILVPCHRVVGMNGSLTGYGGGLVRKEFLLKHEEHCRN